MNVILKKYNLLLLFLLALLNNTKAQDSLLNTQLRNLGLSNISNDYSTTKTNHILKVWDSVNNNHHDKMYDFLPANEWEKILNNRYLLARKNKDTANAIKIAYPLCFVLHTQAKFNYGIQVLEFLYKNKYKLKRFQYKSVLIKLEEEYRHFNNMPMIIKIRNERIENGFIKTFWEIYVTCGLYEEAINDFKLFEPLPVEPPRARLKYFMRLGDLFYDANQLDSAEKYYKIGVVETEQILKKIKSKTITEEGDYVYMRGWFIGLIGNCYVQREDYKKAISLLEYYLTVSKGGYVVNSMLPLSKCYLKLGQVRKAKHYLDQSRNFLAGTSFEKSNLAYFQNKSAYHQIVKEYDSALFYFKAYDTRKNIFVNNILKNQSALLLVKLEIEKRRKELQNTQKDLYKSKLVASEQKIQIYLALAGLLSLAIISIILLINRHQRSKHKKLIEQKNIQLEEYAQKLLQKSTHNEQLVKELHHRVKNNLQNIYSLLNIQKRRTTVEETISFVSSIQGRINSMAIVHESLYNDDNFETIEFENYIRNLVDHLMLAYEYEEKKLSIIYDITPTSFTLEKIILLGLIINEIVSNAFKYSVERNKINTLFISLKKLNGVYHFLIKDNGPGFDMTKVSDKSLGLKLIQTMCLQLDATYKISSINGVEHELIFLI